MDDRGYNSPGFRNQLDRRPPEASDNNGRHTHADVFHRHISSEETSEESRLLDRVPSRRRFYHSASTGLPATMALHQWLSDISVPVYILVSVFAWSSWMDVNGVWVEVPLLVNELPESWNLPSYLVIIIQIANIGPLAYTIANRLAPNKVREWPVVYIIIALGAAVCLLLSFFWRRTSVIAGEEHSTALLTLTGLLSLVDCTSSVVYLPYMAGFKPQYMTSFYIGEGLGGLIPGLVGLIQGVGSEPTCVNHTVVVFNETSGQNETDYKIIPEYAPPRFSVEGFFYFLFAMICLSGVAFSILHFSALGKREKVVRKLDTSLVVDSDLPTYNQSTPSFEEKSSFGTSEIMKVKMNRDEDGKNPLEPSLNRRDFGILLLLIAVCNGLTNGVIPSTQSYTCLPYGNLAYTLAVRLGTVANPLACLLALFVSTKSIAVMSGLSAVGAAITGFHLYLAAMSPAPPLQDSVWGQVVVIVTTILLTACFSYTKVSVASLAMSSNGRWGLLWVGGATQLGSFIGAIVTFILVNVVKVFTSMPPCPTS